MEDESYNTFVDDRGACWITDGDRMVRVNTDLFVRYSYQAYHEGGYPATEEGRRRVERATAQALFRHLRLAPDGDEQVA
jgi:hypothetical protein